MQSKFMSALESLANTLLGFLIAVLAGQLVFPLYGFHPTIAENASLSIVFMVVGIVRSYALRRLFNALHLKHNQKDSDNG